MSELKSGARQRAEAAKAIDAVVSEGRSLDAVLAELDERINPGDRALVKMLCYGTLRFHWRLRAQLRQLVDRRFVMARCVFTGACVHSYASLWIGR